MIMAPISIGWPSVPPTPAMQPMTAMAPITRPRSPPTILPPWAAIRTGRRKVSINGWIEANCAFGTQPFSMNRAVIKPQAMKAPMFGMTMALRNLPNLAIVFFMRDALLFSLSLSVIAAARCGPCGG